MRIFDIIPDPDTLLALEPEELAGLVLEYLNSLPPESAQTLLNTHNFSIDPHVVEGYPRQRQNEIRFALMEAWVWLEREGLLAPKPNSMGEGWRFITRRGQQIRDRNGLEAYRHANLLPKQFLHPVIAQKVWSQFIRGEYDTAVFQAFKEVEVAVRECGGFPANLIGVELMRKAFQPGTGPLTNTDLPEGEQVALRDLFVGAMGSYKNPHSHRNVSIEPVEAAEMIILASHLLNIVYTRHGALVARTLSQSDRTD